MHFQNPMIREAKTSESSALTRIAITSKQYWDYPEEFFDIWKKELTITQDYIEKNNVYVFEKIGALSAFYSVVNLQEDFPFKGDTIPAGIWLDHMFVIPTSIRQGIGTAMFNHCVETLHVNGCNDFFILSDPKAMNFYLKQGCEYIREIPSSIEGRTTPFMVYRKDNNVLKKVDDPGG